MCLKISRKNSTVTYSDLLELGLNYGLICKTCPSTVLEISATHLWVPPKSDNYGLICKTYPFLLDLPGNRELSARTGADLLELGLNYRLICKTCPFLLDLPRNRGLFAGTGTKLWAYL